MIRSAGLGYALNQGGESDADVGSDDIQERDMGIWINELLKNLEKYVDEPTRIRILAGCGAKCPYTYLTEDKVKEMGESCGSEAEFLDMLCERWFLEKEGESYVVVYDHCPCPLVNDDIEGAQKTMCYCTYGNIKRKLAIGLGREVEVTMEGTILGGNKECRFRVEL